VSTVFNRLLQTIRTVLLPSYPVFLRGRTASANTRLPGVLEDMRKDGSGREHPSRASHERQRARV
jgi:hypothetical protein